MRKWIGMVMAGMTTVAMGAALADWPQWRGPERNGISMETGWFKEGAPARTVWEAAVGSGYSSVAIQSGKLYTIGNRSNTDTVVCLDAVKGTALWTFEYACGAGSYPGARSTPAVEGKRVYTLSREGHVFCLDADTGAVQWKRELQKDPGAKAPTWGFSGSPLVLGKAVYLNVGGGGIALDKTTGKTLWASSEAGAGYAAVVPAKLGGKPAVLVFAGKALLSVDPATGKRQWEHAWNTSYDVNAADPLVWEDKVLITSGYGRGGALLRAGAGAPAIVWETKTLASHFASPVLWKGFIYGASGNVGGGQVVCVDPATGQARWSRKETGLCALTLADGKLVLLNEKGTLMVADAASDAYHERFTGKVLDGTCWTAPVVCGGLVYVRNDKGRLLALDLRGVTTP
jgi:outer membrane protein assembly factor BamB